MGVTDRADKHSQSVGMMTALLSANATCAGTLSTILSDACDVHMQ